MATKKLKVALSEAANTADGIVASGSMPITYSETVWDDLRIVPSAFDFAGSSDPALADWQPGGSGTTFKVYEFEPADQGFFTVQLPHTYKHGSNITCHVHWTPGDRGNEESGKTVAWKLNYSWANRNVAFGASSTADMTDSCTGTDDLHEMTPEATITGTGKTISSMLVCRLFRDTGDSWATNTAGNCPILLEVDFHFEQDTPGSASATSKT